MMRALFLTIAALVTAAMTALLVACTTPVALNDRSQLLTLDPGVLSGELQNGFRYYLRSANSSTDSDRLELRLIVKAGSLDEAPDQRGYAHVVEHMAFRGTESFSLASIESLLSQNGLRWGVDVNATTHYGATVYRFSLHNSDENLLPTILSLMSEWLDSIQFDEQALEKEKLIVNAEWRERYAARNHVVDPVAASAYTGSQYENRQPAGDLAIVRASTAGDLREFWQSHYRADNAVLVITGGAHPWKYESMINAAFSRLAATPDTVEQLESTDTLPGADRTGQLTGQLTDQSTNNTSSDLNGISEHGLKYFKDGTLVELLSTSDPTLVLPKLSVNLVSRFDPLPDDVESSVAAIQKRFRSQLLFSAFSYFLRDRVAADPLCSAATLDASLLESGQSVEQLKITLTKNAIEPCLAVAFNALTAVQKSALTEEEYASFANLFERIKQLSLDQYRSRNPASIAIGLVDMVTNGEVVLSAWAMQKILTEVVESFNRDNLNEMINRITDTHHLVISVVTNDEEPYPVKGLVEALTDIKPGLPKRVRSLVVHGSLKPDQTQIRVASKSQNFEALPSIVLPEMVQRSVSTVTTAKPADQTAAQASARIATKLRSEENYHEWRLANGASVILLQDDEYDELSVRAIREGGYQSLSGLPSIAARHLPAYLAVNGIDGYTSRSLGNIMQKKNLFAQMYVDASHHGVKASGRSEELPVMLSLLTAYFREPLILEPQNGSYLRQLKAGKPATIDQALYSRDSTENLDADSFLRVHDELFGTTGNFGFVFVGLVDADQLESELHRLVIGKSSAVPITPKAMSRAVSRATDNIVTLNRAEKFTDVTVNFSCEGSTDTHNGSRNQELLQWQLLSDVISERLRYLLREESGLVYEIESTVPASTQLRHQLGFSILPQDEEIVLEAVNRMLEQLSSRGVSESESNSALARQMRYRMINSASYETVVSDKSKQWLYSGDLLTPDDLTVNLQQIDRLARCLGESVQQVAADSQKPPAATGVRAERADESALQQYPSADR